MSTSQFWKRPIARVMAVFGSHVGLRFSNLGYFEVYECIWTYMTVYDGTWRYMKVCDGIWGYMRVYEGI